MATAEPEEDLQSLAASQEVCHYQDDTDTWTLLLVGENAATKHLENHEQDGLAGSDDFDESCDPVVETIFAIAYSNLNGEAGFQEGEDVLISKLVDDNNDGILNAGDQVIMA